MVVLGDVEEEEIAWRKQRDPIAALYEAVKGHEGL